MEYVRFAIENYRAIKGPMIIDLRTRSLLPLIGLNECGKTTILQAIFAFDYMNDDEYEGRHIKDVLNLYATENATPSIGAALKETTKEWESLVGKYVVGVEKGLLEKKKKIEETHTADKLSGNIDYVDLVKVLQKLPQWKNDLLRLIAKSGSILEIVRNLTSKKYGIKALVGGDVQLDDGFGRYVIGVTPYILYNDDFQDRPPSQVEIPKENYNSSGWLAIYEKLFEETNSSYSLSEAANVEDPRRRDSIVSDVQATLNKTLTKAWRSFHLDRNKKIKVRLSLIPGSGASQPLLQISIVENIGEHERFFEVVDRSKGFLWFYNFVMKTEFNPKNYDGANKTIYLLDEPGSYLHSAAQTRLCEKLKSISERKGNVIYCTHSPHLLDPESIPINDIHIVSKNSRKEISIVRLPNYQTEGERITALQPVFEALQINGQQFSGNGLPVLAVEGIYDKLAIGLFMEEASKYHILPGTSANSIIKNIQFLNAFGRDYVALWDNDEEGRREYGRALKAYGKNEAKRFLLLPAKEGKNRRMEGHFLEEDMTRLRELGGLEKNASYESVMAEIFYGSESLRKKAVEEASDHCKGCFEELQKVVASTLGV